MGEIIKQIATKGDIANLKTGLIYDIRKWRKDIIKWMFFFAIANVASTFVIFYLFLKK